VLYEEPRVTKLDLARFYERIAPRVLPHVEGRPLAVLRCPRGAGDECFFQKHGGGTFPEAVGAVEIQEKSGPARYFTVDSTAGLVSLVQMGILELHPWGSRNDRPDQPDRMIFDVDPAPEVPWERVADAARLVRDVLSDLGLRSFLKTTGGKGLHVVVPLARKLGWDDVKAFSRAVAMQIAKSDPRRYLATASKALRRGRIYVDYLRNARGATAVAAFSTRARPGAPVSTPIAWEELDRGVRADSFGVGNLEERLRRQRKDPWADFAASRQSIPASARRALGL
jgi:bifunctional non-homologous end joining protein LigD